MRLFNAGRLIGEASPALLLLALALVGKLTVAVAVGTYALAMAVSGIFLAIGLRARGMIRAGAARRAEIRKRFWRYSLWNLTSILALKANRAADILVLTMTAPSSAVGFYAIAAASSSAIAIIGTSLGISRLSQASGDEWGHPATAASIPCGSARVGHLPHLPSLHLHRP